MKSLLLLVALAGTAYADAFPHEGPCDDIEACEKACKANKAGTCFYAAVLVLQTAEEGRELRAQKLFDRACGKGEIEACYQSARMVARVDTEDPNRAKTLAAFSKACGKSHARACFMYAQMIKIPEEGGAKQERLALTARKKGLSLMEQRCTKNKIASACDWAASFYSGTSWLKADPKKADALKQQACKIRTGAVCPPPGPPPGRPPERDFTKPDSPPKPPAMKPAAPPARVDSVPTTPVPAPTKMN